MINFQNTEIAFKGRTNSELRQDYLLFKSLQLPVLSRIGPKALGIGFKLGLPIKNLVRATVFRKFCGGQTIDDCGPAIAQLAERHVSTILDYSVEGAESDQQFDDTVQRVIETADAKKKFNSISFCVFKVSGIAAVSYLENVSLQVLRGDYGFESDKSWKVLETRVEKIITSAMLNHIPVLIDAEETWLQPAIDFLAEFFMKRYNKAEAVVYNTVQFYRTDRLAYVRELITRAEKDDIKVGLKIVRGAYMEKERARAAAKNEVSPIHPDKQSSDRAFNEGMSFLVDHIDRVSLCVGTHNEESLQLLAEKMQIKNIKPSDPRIVASQLFGMSDNLTFNLAAAGYHAAKYVPFGPVEETVPYLMRRAEENSSVTDQSGRELSLIEKELKRRRMQ